MTLVPEAAVMVTYPSGYRVSPSEGIDGVAPVLVLVLVLVHLQNHGQSASFFLFRAPGFFLFSVFHLFPGIDKQSCPGS